MASSTLQSDISEAIPLDGLTIGALDFYAWCFGLLAITMVAPIALLISPDMVMQSALSLGRSR